MLRPTLAKGLHARRCTQTLADRAEGWKAPNRTGENALSKVVAIQPPSSPSLVESVANALRQRIMSGELPDGALLPRQEALLAEFGVSPPSLREALRILETEGLITVTRGKIGGAVVHSPSVATAAYMMGLVLQAEQTTLKDLSAALTVLEPACAALCARRPDRATTVMPALREILDQSAELVDDAGAFATTARAFHTTLVRGCGNATIACVIGTLETIWSAQSDMHTRRRGHHGSYSDRAVRLQQALDHERIYRLIGEGDADGVVRAVTAHFKRFDDQGHSFLEAEDEQLTLNDGIATPDNKGA